MRYGIIDVGSNTIRLVIYEKKGHKWIQIENTAEYAGLLSYIEEGNLTPAGKEKLADALLKMKKICGDFGCNFVYAFATASLRDVADQKGLCSWVKRQTGVDMEIISGIQEAEFDYKGLLEEYPVQNGAAFDLGGGSCQLICFEFGRIVEYDSLKIGSLRLYHQYVCGVLPTAEETEAIRRAVRRGLSNFGILKNAGYETIYAMGGAARAAFGLQKYSCEKNEPILTMEELQVLCQFSETTLKKLVPERLTTILPALLTIQEICLYAGAKQIQVVDCGVREGILAKLEKENKRS